MFAIGFGQEVLAETTAAPPLGYIAAAGDNGFIIIRLQQDLREDRNPVPTYPIGGPYPDYYGQPDVCEGNLHPTEQCGQYGYVSYNPSNPEASLAELNDVFEEIASRLFTRLSR